METKPKKKAVPVNTELRLISLSKASEMLAQKHPHLWRNYDALRFLAIHGKLNGAVVKTRFNINFSWRCRYGALVKKLEALEGGAA